MRRKIGKKRVKIQNKEMMVEEVEQRPSFFKIVLPLPTASQKMRIPPDFIKHINKSAFKRRTLNLRGPSDRCWPVKLYEDKKGVFLKDGWKSFFKAHSLGHFEFLLFYYDGKSCFDVKIFGNNGIERFLIDQEDDSSASMSLESCSEDEIISGKEEVFDATTQVKVARRKRGRPRKEFVAAASPRSHSPSSPHVKDDEDKTERVVSSDVNPANQKRKRGRPRIHPIASTSTENGRNLHCQGPKNSKKSEGDDDLSILVVKEEKIEISDDESDLQFEKFDDLKSNQSKIHEDKIGQPSFSKRSYPNEDAFSSRFPFFKKYINWNHVGKYVHGVPLAFTRKYLPRKKTSITLTNEKGNSWEVNFYPTEYYPRFGAGWSVFMQENELKPGDICIFELVEKTEMKVHIFRSSRSEVDSEDF